MTCRMKRIAIGFALLGLTACANDNYSVMPGSKGSQVRLSDDLLACKMRVNHEYYDQKTWLSSAAEGLGGAAGGLVSVGVTEVDGSTIKVGDLNSRVEDCMRGKGYEGTSSN